MTRCFLDAQQVVADLQQHGIVLLDSFFDSAAVAAMRDEAELLLETRDHWRLKRGERSQSDAPVIYDSLNCDMFRDIATRYDSRCEFFVDGRVERQTVPDESITDVHFDTRRSLKFMIYLCDCDKSGAAFRYCLGSHRQNSRFRSRFMLMGGILSEIPNVPSLGETYDLIDMEGRSGTLIIFDTDGFHSAGTLQKGRERLLVRGRTLLRGWYDGMLGRIAHLSPLCMLRPWLVPQGRRATGGKARA